MALHKGLRTLFLLLLIPAVLGGVLGVTIYMRQPRLRLAEAEKALRDGRFGESEFRAMQASPRLNEADQKKALWIAAQGAYGAGRFQATLDYLERAEQPTPRRKIQAAMMEATCYFRLGNADKVEEILLQVLQEDPENLQAHSKLAAVLRIQGRTFDALPHLAKLLRSGNLQEDVLLASLSTEAIYLADSDPQNAKLFVESVPENPAPMLGIARQMAAGQEYDGARAELERIVAARPKQLTAQAVLGRLYLDTGDMEKFAQWLENVRDLPGEHPGIWLVRGIWEQGQGREKEAARCFWEACKLDPNLLSGNYLLAQALSTLGRAEEAEPFVERAAKLAELLGASRLEMNAANLQHVIGIFIALGRTPEAEGWRQLGVKNKIQLAEYREPIPIFEEEGLTDPALSPALHLDLSDYPLPDSAAVAVASAPVPQGRTPVFREVASEAGVSFQHYNGADPTGERVYMFELSGGAAVVLDYDGDHWPDLYLTQGTSFPVDPAEHQWRDRLFRNLGDGTFEDVTEEAGLAEYGLTQSAAAGDMDNDGDPDLFIANLGRNVLYSNNGDGTFTQVDLPDEVAGNVWSSGCGWGDLDGDGFDDVYVVNYLGGPELFTRVCTHNGKPAQCHPRLFPGEQDQLLMNDGRGGFRDETNLIRTNNGKGLGLILADLDGDADMDVFVSNDSVANFAFRNQLADTGTFGLSEEAMLMGLAFDERGWEQACMGIAAADVENDGLLDLFVTNFYREANTLYRQATPGVFVDATRAANLRDSSWLAMGWGTQFLDFELDGDMDLVIANGHLNDLRDEDKAYQMPTELHVNSGGRFEMVPAADLSDYFRREHLGRSVARWDFNRDGLEDFCVSHVDQPIAILRNETPDAGHGLSVQLSAVRTARDAFGSVVEARCGDVVYRQQLTSGCGFAAGNQRQLVFGLGAADKVDELTIHWPSGNTDTYRDVPAGQQVRFIEGRPGPIPQP